MTGVVLTAGVFLVLLAIGGVVATLGRTLGRAAVVLAYYGGLWLDRAFDIRSNELFLLGEVGVTTILAGVGLTWGVSDAIVAFLVGAAFGQTSHVRRIETLIAPMRITIFPYPSQSVPPHRLDRKPSRRTGL